MSKDQIQQRFYLDTSVWRDYCEDRGNGIRPLGEFAFGFLKKCLREKAAIIVSDIVEYELRKDFSPEKIQDIFSPFAEAMARVEHTKEQVKEASALFNKFNRGFPVMDLLHSIIARDEKAIIVSRDKHFKEIGIVESKAPEELL